MSSTSIYTKFRRGPDREQSLPMKIPEQRIPAVKEESAYNDGITVPEIVNMGLNKAYNAVDFGGAFSQTPNVQIGKSALYPNMYGYPMVIGPGFSRTHEQAFFNGAYGHLPVTNIHGEHQLHQIAIPSGDYFSYFRLPARINRIGKTQTFPLFFNNLEHVFCYIFRPKPAFDF
jgi:hypothetical protein